MSISEQRMFGSGRQAHEVCKSETAAGPLYPLESQGRSSGALAQIPRFRFAHSSLTRGCVGNPPLAYEGSCCYYPSVTGRPAHEQAI